MEKVRPWCGQPSDQGRLKHRTQKNHVYTVVVFIMGRERAIELRWCIALQLRSNYYETRILLRYR